MGDCRQHLLDIRKAISVRSLEQYTNTEVKAMATTIRTVYLSKETGKPGWPSKDFEPDKRAAELEDRV